MKSAVHWLLYAKGGLTGVRQAERVASRVIKHTIFMWPQYSTENTTLNQMNCVHEI